MSSQLTDQETSEKLWSLLENGADIGWDFFDELWKVWRWLALCLVSLAAYSAENSIASLLLFYFASLASVATIFLWVYKSYIKSLTSKGRRGRKWVTISMAMFGFVASILMAAGIWVLANTIFEGAI